MSSTVQPPSLDKYQEPHLPSRRFVYVMVVLFMILIVTVCALLIRLHYAATVDVAHRNLQNLAVVQSRYNQEIFREVDDILRSLSFDLADDNLDFAHLLNHYEQLASDNPVLRTLLIFDAEGTVIFDSRDDDPALGMNSSDRAYFNVHQVAQNDDLFVDKPVQSRVDGDWSMPVSRGYYREGELEYVLVASISPMFWSNAFADLNGLEEYIGVMTNTDGTILTTFPYEATLVGTQVDATYLQTGEDSLLLPSMFDDDESLIISRQLETYPLYLIVEVANTEVLFAFDTVSAFIVAIAVVSVLSGIAGLLVYHRQHQALQFQTNSIIQMNHNLKREIGQRKLTEVTLSISEDRYRQVTEIISDYAFSVLVKPDGTVEHEWITDSFRTMMGVDDTEPMPFLSPTTRTHPDDKPKVLADLRKTIAGEETLTEYRTQHSSGEYIWIRVKRRPVWDTTHTRVVRIIGVASNITAQKQAELALQASEQRYRMVTELISDYAFSNIVYEDGTWEPEWLTESFYHMTGYSPQDETQFFLPKMTLHPDDIARAEADINTTINGIPTMSEYRFRTTSDEYLWFRVNRTPIFDDSGRVIKFIGAGSNITAEKEAEFALRDSETRYREVTEMMTDYAFSVSIDDDGGDSLDWVVGSYEEITGKYDVLSQEDDYIVSAEEKEQIKRDKQRTRQGKPTTSEYRIHHRQTGEIRWLRVTRQPIWDDDKQRVIRYIGATSDITAQKDAEQALIASQQHYREVTELMSDYAFSLRFEVSAPGELEWIVGSFEQVTGLTPEQFMDNPYILSSFTHPDDQSKLKADLDKTLKGELTHTQYRVIHARSKAIVWVDVTRQPIWNADHTEVERVVVVVKDITSQKQAEELLAKSEERYRTVTEIISDYVYSERIYPDQSSDIEWVAGSLETILGVSTEDVYALGKIPADIHPDDYRRVTAELLNSRMGNVIVSEYRVIHAVDASIHWVRESRRPIWDEGEDRVVRIISAVSDITNEKTNADKLRESEKRYRILTDLMSDYVFSLNVSPTNRIEVEWFAGRFEEITGVPFEKFKVASQEDMTQISHKGDLTQAQKDVQQTLAGNATISEYRIINAVDNEPRWIRVSRYPVLDPATGQVVRILGATTDITKQKQIEFALRDSEERYRLLTELMTDYAFSVRVEADDRLYREWMIGDFEGIMGYAVPNAGYLDDPQNISPHSENIRMIEHDVARTLQGETTTTEYPVINRRTQQERWIRVTRQPIWNAEHDRVIRYLGAVKDITTEKEAEHIKQVSKELQQDLKRERGLHELRTHFVSMVTHEFRNPLAAIQSSVSILDKYNDRLTEDKKQEKFVRIYGQIDRLTNLLEDLLQVGELQDHALRFSPQRVDIVTIIADLYDQYRDSIGQHHQLTLQHDLTRVPTYGDVILLERAFGNIISNAIKYSPEGSEVITTVAIRNQRIEVTVQDFGMGIPQQDFDNLYKAFYRASNVSTQPGTGLGLIIAKQSIELHKGTIEFESVVGEGTTFTITLPQTLGKNSDT